MPLVLEAAFEAARDDGSPLLIEATCNQVNHQGGYTGMTPVDFRREVEALAARTGFPLEALVLGGDHLGPNPWRHLRAKEAMQEAATMVAAYVAAGFTKIHLDASMACADDSAPLSDDRWWPNARPSSARPPRPRPRRPAARRSTWSAPRCRCRAARPRARPPMLPRPMRPKPARCPISA